MFMGVVGALHRTMSRRLRKADLESEGNHKRSKAASLDECIEET